MSTAKQQGYECPKCKNSYSTAYSMYRHMRKVHNCDVNRCVTLYCPIENCNQSYDRYNALDTHLTHVHYADIRKEQFNFTDLQDFENWLRDITSSSKTKYIKRSCNNSYRYYRCHRSGLPKTSTDKINSMKSTVKIGRHCPSRIIAKITDRSVQVEFVPTHIGHECEIAKIPLSQKKRHDIACRLASNSNNNNNNNNNTNGNQSTSTASNLQSDHSTTNSVNMGTNNSGASLANNSSLHSHSDHNHHHHHHNHQQNSSSGAILSHQSSDSQLNATPHQAAATTGSASTSSMIQGDNSPLMATLAPMKALPQSQQLGPSGTSGSASSTLQHLVPATTTTNQQQLVTTAAANQLRATTNDNMGISLGIQQQQKPQQQLHMTTPSRQELTQRFEQLMSSIRSDKHASIVKAQLEVCFALIRD